MYTIQNRFHIHWRKRLSCPGTHVTGNSRCYIITSPTYLLMVLCNFIVSAELNSIQFAIVIARRCCILNSIFMNIDCDVAAIEWLQQILCQQFHVGEVNSYRQCNVQMGVCTLGKVTVTLNWLCSRQPSHAALTKATLFQ